MFTNDFPVNRTREIVGPVPAPLGWIKRGRDLNLEQAILAGIRERSFCKGIPRSAEHSVAFAASVPRRDGPARCFRLRMSRASVPGPVVFRSQLALNVQYAPRPAIPIQRIVGSSKAARCAGDAIHIDPILETEPMAEFCRRAGPITKWPIPRAA